MKPFSACKNKIFVYFDVKRSFALLATYYFLKISMSNKSVKITTWVNHEINAAKSAELRVKNNK